MKKIFKYFCGCLLCCNIVAALTSCSDDNDPTYFGEVRVSSSYIAIPQNGGSTSITVTTTSEWSFEDQLWILGKDTVIAPTPRWLTVSTDRGPAGQTTVTFSAESTLDGRNCELLIHAADKVQRINVIQGLSTVSNATCAEVIAGPDSKTYRVTGTVTSIANTTYGNWYLQDATGTIYIYGTLDAKGNTKNFLSLGLEVGDEVTVEGPKTTYNTTVELVDVTVININKSLIKCDSLSTSDPLPIEGGDVTAFITCKGNGFGVDIPEDAKSWLTISAVTPNSVTFHAAANTGADRSATVVFNTKANGKEYTSQVTISQKGVAKGTGTDADPFNVAAAISYTRALGADVKSEQDIFVKGIISSIKYTYSAQYGTATYNISDDGTENGVFTVYGSYYFDGKPWTEEDDQIKVGDEVIVCGKVINYGGNTPEFASKENWLVSLNGKSSFKAVSVADFLAAEVGDARYALTGVITELYASDKQGKSFYIADHTGTTLIYRAEGFIEAGAKVGDVVTVVGKRGAYKESPQMVSGNMTELKYAVTPISIADFRNVPDDTEKYYLISGTITEATESGTKNDVEKYGNFNLTDDSGSVYIYGVLKGWGGAKGEFGGLGIGFGDKLTIIAYKTTYKGLVEGVGVYLSHEKKQ